MKKIFYSVLPIIIFLCCSTILFAQFPGGTFTTKPTGGNYSSLGTWVGGMKPPSKCSGCKIIMNGPVIIDIAGIVYDHQSEVLLTDGTNLTVNQRFVMKDTSSLLVGNTPTAADTLTMQAEMDLFKRAYVRLANSNDFVDVSGITPSPSDSLPTNVFGVGIYYIDGPTVYDIVLTQSGYGEPPAPANPQYNINCIPSNPPPGNVCSPLFVYGPAKIDTSTTDHLWEFVVAAILPVKLSKFDANLNNNQTVDIIWATSQEVNSNYFSIQRSSDGINFIEIGRVKAKGVSSIASNYVYTDPQVLTGIYYYRLQIIDLDGKFDYSRILSISSDTKTPQVVVFNNPFTDQIRLKLNTAFPEKLKFTLTDLIGRTCLQQYYSSQAGSNLVNLQTTNSISAGVYFLNIKANSFSNTIKLIKR